MKRSQLFPLFVGLYLSLGIFHVGCSDKVTPVIEEEDKVDDSTAIACDDQYGAPPMPTTSIVSMNPSCKDADLLTWKQGSVTRYACLNYPDQADTEDYQWPMIVYLHGSLRDPSSLYSDGVNLYDLRNDYQLSDNENIHGFIILSPQGRRATPYKGDGPQTGTGYHWDEWYRNSEDNLDALAIDHFIDSAKNTGKVDTSRIYVYGWSNGAYMTVLYSTWRSSMVAAMGQYAGGDPWTRTPCPISKTYTRQVPLFLLRNLCDKLVPCSASSEWIDTLKANNWPFEYYSLDSDGAVIASDVCSTDTACAGTEGLREHFRWPDQSALKLMLEFFKAHPLS
ncbi:MAG: hypothetical protein AB7H80_15925 [Candidatus Kapaibacterium sp.]